MGIGWREVAAARAAGEKADAAVIAAPRS